MSAPFAYGFVTHEWAEQSPDEGEAFRAHKYGMTIVVWYDGRRTICGRHVMVLWHPHYNLRMARNNWTLSCAEPAIWELMDAITQQYAIDPDRIYGSGQSMGGMTVMAMAAQRDNYFAALLPMSCKWGNNFNKEYPFNGTSYYSMPADGKLVWQKDSDGRPVDYRNWFYMVSDDNILYLNTAQENTEYRVLYDDLAGAQVPRRDLVLDDKTTASKRDASIRRLVSEPNETGIYQAVLTGNVSHMSA